MSGATDIYPIKKASSIQISDCFVLENDFSDIFLFMMSPSSLSEELCRVPTSKIEIGRRRRSPNERSPRLRHLIIIRASGRGREWGGRERAASCHRSQTLGKLIPPIALARSASVYAADFRGNKRVKSVTRARPRDRGCSLATIGAPTSVNGTRWGWFSSTFPRCSHAPPAQATFRLGRHR